MAEEVCAAMADPRAASEPAGSSQAPAQGKKKRAPSWSGAEILDLTEVCGEEANLRDLCTRFRNMDVYSRMATSLGQKGHMHTQDQVRVKSKEFRQAYTKARECSSCSGVAPQTCHFYEQLYCILKGCVCGPFPPPNVDSSLEMPVVSLPEGGAVDEEEEVKEKDEASQDRMPTSQEVILCLGAGAPLPGCRPGFGRSWGRPMSWTSCK